MSTTSTASVLPKEPFGGKRVLLLAVGSITALVALALLASGGAALWGLGQRDNGGFFTSGTHEFSTSSYALASESLDVGPDIPGWLEDGIATVRVEATSAKPLFIGIGRVVDVERYLADVEHAQITSFGIDPFSVRYRALGGTAEPAPPASQDFWRAQATGSGSQSISWPVEEGTWSVVVMNADGSRNVSVDARLGTRIEYLGWLVIGVLGAGVLVLALGARLIYSGTRRPHRDAAAHSRAARDGRYEASP